MNRVPLEAILKQEQQNARQIHLYRDGKFYVAYELSAYLMKTFLWSELKVTIKYQPPFGNCLRVGFPLTSWEKVKASCDQQNLTTTLSDDKLQLTIATLTVDSQAYVKWKQEFLSNYNQAKIKMRPFYGGLPVYKKSYDLWSLALSTVRKFPKDLQELLGSRILNLFVDCNQLFRQVYQEENTLAQQAIIVQLDEHYDTLAFLFRLAFDQQALGLERNVDIADQVGEIRRQLKLWRNKLNKNVVTT
ncbi:four helix bundle protein [bacterium]|nr:four helix bundle protein [bacterium]